MIMVDIGIDDIAIKGLNKNMSYKQISKKTPISMLGDADNDNVPNIMDCKPLDSNRDGLFGRAVNILSRGRFGQSKADYEAEKITKTYFERDPSTGRVTSTFKNGRQVLHYKSADQLLREYQEDKIRKQIEKQRLKVEKLKQQTKLKKLRAKERELLEKQRSQSLKYPKHSVAQEAISMIFGIPQPRMLPAKPGYYIEKVSSKLPKGYKYKKIPKSKKPGRYALCPHCNVPLILMPGVFGMPVLKCPQCSFIGG